MTGRAARACGAFLMLFLACGALVAGAAAVCPAGDCRPTGADRLILSALEAHRLPYLDAFFRGVTWLGSIAVLLPLALLLAWRYAQRGMRGAALLMSGSLAGAWLLAQLGKLLVGRPRPELHPALIEMPSDPSFPSAHAVQIAAVALAWALAPGTRRTLEQLAAAASVVLLVALSRLYLQVHFPSDVLFGLIAAGAWVLGLHLLVAGFSIQDPDCMHRTAGGRPPQPARQNRRKP
jgi:undecaprenyl-diphosphatase